MKQLILAALVAAVAAIVAPVVLADSTIDRGKYLVDLMVCGDCHSPHTEDGAPDMTRALTGGLGFEVPKQGIFWAPNLTPHETGLAAWSEAEIVTALRTGHRPDGRVLVPVMPWPFLASLTDEDAQAIARYLKSLKPVENAVPEPVGPGQPATEPYLALVFPKAPKS